MLSVQMLLYTWDEFSTRSDYKIEAPGQKVEFRAAMETLHVLKLELLIKPIGAKFRWDEDTSTFKIERWILTADPWGIMLCFDIRGNIFAPTFWRRMLPYKHITTSWDPRSESLHLAFRYCCHPDGERVLAYIAMVATEIGKDAGDKKMEPPYGPPTTDELLAWEDVPRTHVHHRRTRTTPAVFDAVREPLLHPMDLHRRHFRTT